MFIPKPSNEADYDPPPAGTHVAVCYRFIDLGTQKSSFQGKDSEKPKVMISWELGDELMQDGRPFTVSKRYTWSMHQKAVLRKDLEMWRGKAFEDSDFEGPSAFNTKKLLGAACMLSIVHETRGTGPDTRVYGNIAGISKLTKGVTPPMLVNPKIYLALDKDGWSPEVYASLSDKLKQTIAGTPQYKELMKALSRPDDHDDPPPGFNSYNDDIPF